MAQLTRDRFLELMAAEGVPASWYGLSGGHPPEALVLDKRGAGWVVYYSERGLETGLRMFDSEDEAYRYMLDGILFDLGLMSSDERLRITGKRVVE